jgi:hypothetical protein
MAGNAVIRLIGGGRARRLGAAVVADNSDLTPYRKIF